MNPPDLDAPAWQLLIVAAMLGIVALLIGRHERKSRDASSLSNRHRHVGLEPDRMRSEARDRSGLRHLDDEAAGGARNRPEHDRGGHRPEVREQQEHDERNRVRPLPRLSLTDDELVALARYLRGHGRLTIADTTDLPLTDAVRRVCVAASELINADRADGR